MARSISTLIKQLQTFAQDAVQGTLVETMMRCGTPTCGCHKDPKRRHGPHIYLKFRGANGKSTSMYVPRRKEQEIRKAVEAWSSMWETMVELSHRNREAFKTQLRREKQG